MTAENQPSLHGMVEHVASRMDVPGPDRVWLVDNSVVRTELNRGRRDLLIGFPVLCCLSRAQLEALVAHEVSALRYPKASLVLRLRSAYRREMGGRRSRSPRNLSKLGPFWSTVEDDGDAAAMSFADSAAVAEALVSVDLAVTDFLDYTMDQRAPRRGEAIQNLDDGWPRYVGSRQGDSTLDDDHEDLGAQHTALAGAIRHVPELSLRLADDWVEVAPLTEAEQRLLATKSLMIRGRVRWYTFATAPAQWWVARAEKDVATLRRVLKITDDEQFAGDGDVVLPMLLRYAEYRLLSQGWTLEHPAARTVLISGDGVRVDLAEIDKQAVLALIAPRLMA